MFDMFNRERMNETIYFKKPIQKKEIYFFDKLSEKDLIIKLICDQIYDGVILKYKQICKYVDDLIG